MFTVLLLLFMYKKKCLYGLKNSYFYCLLIKELFRDV